MAKVNSGDGVVSRSTGSIGGGVLIGSFDIGAVESMKGFIAARYKRDVTGVTETSELILAVIGRELDLVIIDTNLKGLPPAKTVQIIKKCRPRLPVIVISDDYTVDTGSRIMEQGVFYYMYKPIELDKLGELVERALMKRARENSGAAG
ncbi:MAG: response regulator [Nitrospirota bacterium]